MQVWSFLEISLRIHARLTSLDTSPVEVVPNGDPVQANTLHCANAPVASSPQLPASSEGLLVISRQDASIRTPPKTPESGTRERSTVLGTPTPIDESSVAVRHFFSPGSDTSSTPQIDRGERPSLTNNGIRTARRRQQQHRSIFANNNI